MSRTEGYGQTPEDLVSRALPGVRGWGFLGRQQCHPDAFRLTGSCQRHRRAGDALHHQAYLRRLLGPHPADMCAHTAGRWKRAPANARLPGHLQLTLIALVGGMPQRHHLATALQREEHGGATPWAGPPAQQHRQPRAVSGTLHDRLQHLRPCSSILLNNKPVVPSSTFVQVCLRARANRAAVAHATCMGNQKAQPPQAFQHLAGHWQIHSVKKVVGNPVNLLPCLHMGLFEQGTYHRPVMHGPPGCPAQWLRWLEHTIHERCQLCDVRLRCSHCLFSGGCGTGDLG